MAGRPSLFMTRYSTRTRIVRPDKGAKLDRLLPRVQRKDLFVTVAPRHGKRAGQRGPEPSRDQKRGQNTSGGIRIDDQKPHPRSPLALCNRTGPQTLSGKRCGKRMVAFGTACHDGHRQTEADLQGALGRGGLQVHHLAPAGTGLARLVE